jgi:hypothetical protein
MPRTSILLHCNDNIHFFILQKIYLNGRFCDVKEGNTYMKNNNHFATCDIEPP